MSEGPELAVGDFFHNIRSWYPQFSGHPMGFWVLAVSTSVPKRTETPGFSCFRQAIKQLNGQRGFLEDGWAPLSVGVPKRNMGS